LRAMEWRTAGLDEAWRGALHAVAMRSGARRAAARKWVNRMEDPWADMADSYAATRIVGFAREFWMFGWWVVLEVKMALRRAHPGSCPVTCE
jgi:hypothetical protein